MSTVVEFFKVKVFCKHCIATTMMYLKFGFNKALHADTITFEIFEGLLALLMGVVLFFTAILGIPTDFKEVVFCGYLSNVAPQYWAALYSIIGILLLYGAAFGSLLFRKRIAIIVLYLWLYTIYYIFNFGNPYSVEFILYSTLALSSVFTYLTLWRFKWM